MRSLEKQHRTGLFKKYLPLCAHDSSHDTKRWGILFVKVWPLLPLYHTKKTQNKERLDPFTPLNFVTFSTFLAMADRRITTNHISQ